MPAKRERAINRTIRNPYFTIKGKTGYEEMNICREINRAEFLMEFKNHVESLHF